MARLRRFKDRREAGRLLARRLRAYAGRADAIVLGLPRGGVPVGVEVARKLDLAFDVLMVRKLGVPGHEELAAGAVTSDGLRVLQRDVLAGCAIAPEWIDMRARAEVAEMARREQGYRRGRPPPSLGGRVVILTDDGVATGATMWAAVGRARQAGAARVVVAAPVCAPEAWLQLRPLVDQCVCLLKPEPFMAVGAWYGNFAQISDAEVEEMLERLWRGGRRPVAKTGMGASS